MRLIQKGKIFIGYKVTHNYRADNNSGNTLIGNNVFFIDKDFKEVTYSMDLDEYNEMINSINKIKGLIEEESKTNEENAPGTGE